MSAPVSDLIDARTGGRAYTCGGCGEERVTPTMRGPFPRLCAVCDPDAEVARRFQRDRSRTAWQRRSARIAELESRVAELEAMLRIDPERAFECGEPGRDALARAVARLARAQGVGPTRHALLVIRDLAATWASRIDRGPGRQPGRRAA